MTSKPVKMKNRIKEFRARHDLTQEELANQVDVRRETIGHIEKGRYNLSLLLAWRIAQALESSLEELYQFEEE
jgi:putative transcriptional regulator